MNLNYLKSKEDNEKLKGDHFNDEMNDLVKFFIGLYIFLFLLGCFGIYEIIKFFLHRWNS